MDLEQWKVLEGETIKTATVVGEDELVLEFASGRKVRIGVGSSTPSPELTPFLYVEEAK